MTKQDRQEAESIIQKMKDCLSHDACERKDCAYYVKAPQMELLVMLLDEAMEGNDGKEG